jgi:dynein heavy chain, axonemal
LEGFQKLLLIKILREEKLLIGVSYYICEILGKELTEPQNLDLHSAFKDSSNTIPIIFILSSGADPMRSLLRFEKDMDMGDSRKLRMISLG